MTHVRPPCSGTCGGEEVAQRVDLKCGCTDIVYTDGTICFEHNHVECDGKREQMKPIELDLLTRDELQDIIRHFASTSADFYVRAWDGIEMFVSRVDFTTWLKVKGEAVAAAPRKKIGSQLEPEVPKAAPNCKDHRDQKMRYNAAEGVFICPVPQCKVTARPKVKKEDLKNTVITGQFELVKTPGDKFYLYVTSMDTMIDINSVIEMTGTGQVHGTESDWTVMCRFPAIRDLEGEVDG